MLIAHKRPGPNPSLPCDSVSPNYNLMYYTAAAAAAAAAVASGASACVVSPRKNIVPQSDSSIDALSCSIQVAIPVAAGETGSVAGDRLDKTD